jgi:hypothetical protein
MARIEKIMTDSTKQNKKAGNITKTYSKLLYLLGCMLIIINIIGFFNYKTIEDNHPKLIDDSKRTVSEKEFWKRSEKLKKESSEEYAKRLTELVSQRMLIINPYYAKPTMFENWILWVWSNYLGYYEWINTHKAVRLGGGYCSQHSIVFNNILRSKNIESRILALGGHVVNEAYIDGYWRVYDPEYNVVFNYSLRELEEQPNRVYLSYKNAGRPEKEALHWKGIFASYDDNWHYESSKIYAPKKYVIENLSFFLIWIIPSAMIFAGWMLRKKCRQYFREYSEPGFSRETWVPVCGPGASE